MSRYSQRTEPHMVSERAEPTDDQGSSPVLTTLTDGVLVLTFNRPHRHNAYTYELEAAYFDALASAAEDPDVRVIVVTGAGKSFCPGLDTNLLDAIVEQGTLLAPRFDVRRPITFPTTIPKPIVCAINGACAGLGFVTAVLCDVRFAARGAKFTTAFVRRGLPAEEGIAWLLSRLIGHGPTLELLLSGRVFEADEAHALGLVHAVEEPDHLLGTAVEYARELASACSPAAMSAIKSQVYSDLDSTLEESRRRAAQFVEKLTVHPDFIEGVRSFIERRPASFALLSGAQAGLGKGSSGPRDTT